MSLSRRCHVGGLGQVTSRDEPPAARRWSAGSGRRDNARAEAGERFVWLTELFDGVARGHGCSAAGMTGYLEGRLMQGVNLRVPRSDGRRRQ